MRASVRASVRASALLGWVGRSGWVAVGGSRWVGRSGWVAVGGSRWVGRGGWVAVSVCLSVRLCVASKIVVP